MNANKILLTLTIIFVALVVALVTLLWKPLTNQPPTNQPPATNQPLTTASITKLARFASAEEFRSYVEQAPAPSSMLGGFTTRGIQTGLPETAVGLGTSDLKLSQSTPDRVSATNVQVKGIDEPDIVKTDGNELFISSEGSYYFEPQPLMLEEKSIAPPRTVAKTNIVKAFPVDAITQEGDIDQTGQLLLAKDTLLVFSYQNIYGYDVSDPKAPKRTWTFDYGKQSGFVSARLKDGKVYLVTRTNIARRQPCPIEPFAVGGALTRIPCTDIYHPVGPVAVDVTYTALVLDPQSGKVGQTVSFVGSADATIVSMSEQALYLTFQAFVDPVVTLYKFYSEAANDLVPAETLQKMQKLQGYDLSSDAKLTELMHLITPQYDGTDDDEQAKLAAELENRAKTYQQAHQREFERTAIVKIGLKDLKVEATGEIPGTLLNQFALDEYDGTVRAATTVGGGFFFFTFGQSVNDVYTLDRDLRQIGSVLDLGKGEQIYSVRFIGDRGYVVTFRRIDPFYVLDLSNPKQPERKGELKIPGFSSYLDPLSDTLVLGVGEENSKVKASLFDVSDAANPKELATYQLPEYWTEVQSNHHAFLHDAKHKVFFLPAGQKGYILSYEDNQLTLKKALATLQAKRAVYINDNLYVIGQGKLVVLRETDWEQVKDLTY